MAPPRIIFAGSGEFGSPTLRMLAENGHEIVTVYTQPDRPAGRGKKLTPTPIAHLGQEGGLPVIRTSNINAETLPPADVLVVIAFGQKIAEAIVKQPRFGAINLHASMLPKYRGAAPINWAIVNGEETTGNSVIRLANKMDAGAILARSEVTIGATETAGELHDRLAVDGALLVRKVLTDLVSGTAREREQDHATATLAPKLSRDTAVLDWSQPAAVIARRINGLSPWPGCRVRLVDGEGSDCGRLTLLRSSAIESECSSKQGQVTASGSIGTGDGKAVEILQVQPEGKRPMSLDDYRRGNRWAAGMHLESI